MRLFQVTSKTQHFKDPNAPETQRDNPTVIFYPKSQIKLQFTLQVIDSKMV